MDPDLGWEQVLKALKPYARNRVDHIYVSRDAITGKGKGYGFVHFRNWDERERCINDQRYIWNKHKISVRLMDERRIPEDFVGRLKKK